MQCKLCSLYPKALTPARVEHKNMSSSTGKHYKDEHSTVPTDFDKQFSVLKKCDNNFDCLVHEMLLIRKLTPFLNVH